VADKRRLSKADYRRLSEFRYHLRVFLAFSEHAADKAGLTTQQHQVLLAIKGSPSRDVSIRQLAERLGVKHHSAVGLIDRLAMRGLVKRRPGSADKRHVFIDLTPKAEAILRRLSLAHRNELRRLAPTLKKLLSQLEDDD